VRENGGVVKRGQGWGERPLPRRPAGSPFSLSALSCPVSPRCYHGIVTTKQQIRDRIWEILQRRGVACFPGAVGRIPNFDGATKAAELTGRLDVWQRASVLKCNPDSPQFPVRQAALREGKTIYMAVPRLRQERCFIELDPLRLGRRAGAAATIRGAFMYGRAVTVDELRPIDLVICGSVAVNRMLASHSVPHLSKPANDGGDPLPTCGIARPCNPRYLRRRVGVPSVLILRPSGCPLQ
jgi:5-formyltetrahydrofolate cyclo-ligase